jgi:peptide/nickel transport system permease protein
MGMSMSARRPVGELLSSRIVSSLTLAVLSIGLATAVAGALGMFTGRRIGTQADVVTTTSFLVLGAIPPFVLGLVLILIFAVGLGWLPTDSTATIYATGWPKWRAYILPAVTLACAVIPYIAQAVRRSIHETSAAPFVQAAYLRGIGKHALLWRHIVPVASPPIIAVVTLSLGDLILGVVIVETVFGFPGLGQLLVTSVAVRDIAVVQPIVLLVGATYILLNLVSDWLGIILDPRVE